VIKMLNKAIIMGRLTRDPEMRYTQSNIAVCSFSVAVDRNYIPAGGQRQTDFINVVAWRSTAEFVGKYFSKGKMIVVCGSIQTRTWDGQDGRKNYATEIVADEVFFGESKRDGDSAPSAYYPAAPAQSGSAGNAYAPPQPYEAVSAPAMPQAPVAPNLSANMGEADFVPIDTDDDLPF